MNKLSDKAKMYARSYGQPPYGREIEGTAELLLQMAEKLAEYEDLEEQGKLLKLPCAVGDTVYDIVLCDDGKRHIFEMQVCCVMPFGELRYGKLWNVYLENEHTKAYRSFYVFGKTVFLTREEAEAALKELQKR